MVSELTQLCMLQTQTLQVIPSDPIRAQNRETRMAGSIQNRGGCSSGQKPHCPQPVESRRGGAHPSGCLLSGSSTAENQAGKQSTPDLGKRTQFLGFLIAQESREPTQVYFPERISRSKDCNEETFGDQLFLHPKPAGVEGKR